MAQTEIKKVISIDTKSSNKSINSLKKDIDALSSSLNDLEIGTKEYNETLALLGKRQSEFNKINEQIARSSRTTAQRFESVAKISTGLASGYGAATAAITLFGKESEDLNKVMVKLQSTIALVQGVGGIKDLLEELPTLGNWFKKLTDFISPFNTGLNNAAKNLNQIDAAKLNNIGTSVGNVGTELGNISKVVKDLEGANINFKVGMIQGVMGTPEEINSTNKSVSNTIPIVGKFNDTVKNSANSMKVTSEELERLKRNSPAIAAALNKQADAAKGLADGTSQAAKATTAFSKATTALKTIGNVTVWIALATAIGLAINKVIDYVSSIRTAAKEQEEFRKSITDATNQISSKSIAIFKELQIAYERVGDSADAKQEFLNKYADKIKETGLNINTVAQAEDAFINNTGNYVAALTARAKAQAIEEQAIKIYEEYLNKRSELEHKIEDTNFGEASAWQAFKATAMFWKDYQGQIYEYTKQNKENTYNELSDLNREIEERLRKMFEDVAELNKKYGGFFDIEVIKNNTTQAKEEINEFDVWLQNRLNAKNPVDELEDEYIRLLALAIKYNRGIEEVEAWHQEELKKIRDKAREDEENARKSAADKAWNDFQAELKRIRDLSSTSNLREPVEQTFQTTYTQGASKAFGLAGDYNGTGYKFTYQSRDDLNNQYKAQTEYNNELLRLTRERILQENELLNEQLSNEQLSADRRLEIERILDENKRALSDAEIKNEQANTQAYQHLQQARQQALQGTLSVASSVAGSMATI
jgi:gas vesicle protein